MNISIAVTDGEIAACYPVMRELRPHIGEAEFVERIRKSEKSGYKLAYLSVGDEPVAVAGFRVGENLAWGRFLYVDDLVTSAHQRSQGYGTGLLVWIRAYALEAGCAQLHLDSGMQRADAHRFYEREGLIKAGFHFSENLSPDPVTGG